MAVPDLFAGVLPFVHTAEQRSFRRAAERLGVTAAAVSKAVAKLERDLGARLLERTSRHVALTVEGQAFLDRCREAVAHVQAGRELVTLAQRAPRGTVTVSLPFILSRAVVPALVQLAARYPGLAFDLRVTDRFARLAEDAIDVAIRIGDLPSSTLVARRLRETRWVTVASPAYLARAGTPRRPEELARHNCLKFLSPQGGTREWPYRGRGAVATSGNLRADYGGTLVDAALAGLGLCQLFDFMVADHLRERRLVEVLADHAAAGPPIHAVYLPGRKASPRVRALVEALVEALARPGAG